jgi:hypothetical protein
MLAARVVGQVVDAGRDMPGAGQVLDQAASASARLNELSPRRNVTLATLKLRSLAH